LIDEEAEEWKTKGSMNKVKAERGRKKP